VIALDDLHRRFGSFALAGINLRIDPGGYGIILGPSGCGKSLLLTLIAGLTPLDRGTIHLDGLDVTALPPERRQVGMVFQGGSLFPHLDVRDNIGYGLRMRGASPVERERRVDELVELLALGPLCTRPVSLLSGGEAQKVALARALAPRPRVLLLDEPLSQVDHHARQELVRELKRIHHELKVTTLHVTHNREEAAALGDFCAILLGGRVVQAGSFAEVHERPACAFVRYFLGQDDRPVPASRACSGTCREGLGVCDGH